MKRLIYMFLAMFAGASAAAATLKLDAKGGTVEVNGAMVAGYDSLSITSSVAGGKFRIKDLKGFRGLLVTRGANHRLEFAGSGDYSEVRLVGSGGEASVSAEDIVFCDCTDFSGSIYVKEGAKLNIAAGHECSMNIAKRGEVRIVLSDLQGAIGFSPRENVTIMSETNGADRGRAFMVDSSGHTIAEGYAAVEGNANTWNPGDDFAYEKSFCDASRWSDGKVPENGDNTIIMSNYTTLSLDLTSDLSLGVVLVDGSGVMDIVAGDGEGSLYCGVLTNAVPLIIECQNFHPDSIVPGASISIRDCKGLKSTIAYDIDSGYLSPEQLQDPIAWNGTIWLKDKNFDSFRPMDYANERSTLRMTGVTGGFAEGSDIKAPLELVDSPYGRAALTITNPSSFIIRRLTGDGTFAVGGMAGVENSDRIVIWDADGFSGMLDVAAGEVAIGEETTGNGTALRGLRIAPGASAVVSRGATLRVDGTIEVGGSLDVRGRIIGNIAVFDGATLNFGKYGSMEGGVVGVVMEGDAASFNTTGVGDVVVYSTDAEGVPTGDAIDGRAFKFAVSDGKMRISLNYDGEVDGIPVRPRCEGIADAGGEMVLSAGVVKGLWYGVESGGLGDFALGRVRRDVSLAEVTGGATLRAPKNGDSCFYRITVSPTRAGLSPLGGED